MYVRLDLDMLKEIKSITHQLRNMVEKIVGQA